MKLCELVDDVSNALLSQKKMLVTAESCTGGLIAKLMTDRAGSSAVFERGFVTYTNDAKMDLLNVSPEIFDKYGAVSKQCALEMARGALKNSKGHIAISVTGIAGPSGDTAEKPVGLVYIGIAKQGHIDAFECHFKGTREEIREQTAVKALEEVLKNIR